MPDSEQEMVMALNAAVIELFHEASTGLEGGVAACFPNLVRKHLLPLFQEQQMMISILEQQVAESDNSNATGEAALPARKDA